MQINDNHKKPENIVIQKYQINGVNRVTHIHTTISYSEAGMQMVKIKRGNISNSSNKLMISDYHSKTDITITYNDAYTEAGTAKSQ